MTISISGDLSPLQATFHVEYSTVDEFEGAKDKLIEKITRVFEDQHELAIRYRQRYNELDLPFTWDIKFIIE